MSIKAHANKPCGIGAALAIGLGSIIGGSMFATMGEAIQGAGGAAPLAYFLGALPAYITAYSYTRMAAAHPGAGGTMAYFNLAYGGGYLSASLNLMLVVCYAAVASLYAGIFGDYLADLCHWHTPTAQRIFSSLGIIAVAWANTSRSALSKRIQNPLNTSKFVIMGFFVLAALLSPLWEWQNFAPHHWQCPGSILTTGLTIFMSYQGFELITAIRQPFRRHALPAAMALCLIIVTLYYCGVAYCTVGNVDYATADQESSYLLSAIARRILGEPGGILLCLGAIIASTSAMNADVFSVSDIPEEMAQEHEMPRYFLPSHRDSKTLGVLFLCGLLILFVNLLNIVELTAIASLGFLTVYTLANFAALRITHHRRTATWLSSAGGIICLVSACIVAQQLFTGVDSSLLIYVTLGMLGLPFIWQAIYYLHRRR